MPEAAQNIYLGISSKVRIICERHEMLVRTLEQEREAMKQLREEIETLRRRVDELQAECDGLKAIRAAAPTPEQAEQTRALLTGLVREIDRCIAELKAC